MNPKLPTIYKHELYEYLSALKVGLGKRKRSRAAQGAIALAEEIEAHFGLSRGAEVTIVREE